MITKSFNLLNEFLNLLYCGKETIHCETELIIH